MSRRIPRILALTGLIVGVVWLALWLGGGLEAMQAWAADQQRQVQTLIAGAVRRLRAGEPGSGAALIAVCFTYGVVHAVGPGHGKVLIGGYGIGTRVPVLRLSVLSVLASLAQAGVAVALVWGGINLLNLTREALTDLAEQELTDLSTVLIGLVGLWLMLRGLRQLWRQQAAHDHHHHHDENCGCGHAHGPSPEQAIQTRSIRDAAALILGIAIRPCTGALFLLILTWRLDIFAMGVAGSFAMGLGTAAVTVAVAILSVWAREGGLSLLPETGAGARVLQVVPAIVMVAAGGLIALIATGMLI
ncbi:nickel/cobalt transporter [Paracoccus homiensis]|uniref:nickel/cobalt transporter n=1 Tax=Paracoccus homiensis TaxID=364199 RepID=UPI00398D59D6